MLIELDNYPFLGIINSDLCIACLSVEVKLKTVTATKPATSSNPKINFNFFIFSKN